MIIRLIVALTLSIFTATTAIADDVYRWTDPESGKILVAPKPPPYPIKETRMAGRLPNGDMVDLVLDLNAPEVKVLLEKRKVREAEQKRIAEEQARQRAARAAEEERIAAEQAKKRAEREAELAKERLKQEEEQKSAAAGPKTTVEETRQERSEQIKRQENLATDTLDADIVVNLINAMYGNVCHAEITGFFSKTLKLDWTANTKKIHAIKVMAEIGSIKEKLYRDGVRYFQFPNDAGTYNVIDWKTGEKKSINERTKYYFSN